MEVRTDLSTLKDSVNKILGKLSPLIVESGNPLHLTSLGEHIANDLGASEWANTTAMEAVDDVQDKEPFEIDAYCDRLGRSNLSSAMRRQVRKKGVRAWG